MNLNVRAFAPRQMEHAENRPETRKYGRVASDVMRSPLISIPAKAIYAILSTYADRDGIAYPGLGRLAEEMRLSKPHLIRYIDELATAGVIEKMGHNRARKYRMIGNVNVTSIGNASVTDNGNGDVTNTGYAGVTDEANGNAGETGNGNAGVTTVIPSEHSQKGEREDAPAREGACKDPAAPGRTSEPGELLSPRVTYLPDGTALIDTEDLTTSVARAQHWPEAALPILQAWIETHDNRVPRMHDSRELILMCGRYSVDQILTGIRWMGDQGKLKLADLKDRLAQSSGASEEADLSRFGLIPLATMRARHAAGERDILRSSSLYRCISDGSIWGRIESTTSPMIPLEIATPHTP